MKTNLLIEVADNHLIAWHVSRLLHGAKCLESVYGGHGAAVK